MNPWHPMNDPIDLKTLGKMLEELGECSSAASRCLIQGIAEVEPTTGKVNKVWLEEEIADVLATANLVIKRFNLDLSHIFNRCERKKAILKNWHDQA